MNWSFPGGKLHRERNDGNERKRLLQVYAFFKGDSKPSFLLQKAASSLSGEGLDLSLALEGKIDEKTVKRAEKGAILAFFDTPEKRAVSPFLPAGQGERVFPSMAERPLASVWQRPMYCPSSKRKSSILL